MSWQDLILTGGTIIFTLSLLPSVLGKDKPAISTSVITGTTLSVFSIVYLTLAFWFTAAITAVAAILWFTMAIQSLRMKASQPVE